METYQIHVHHFDRHGYQAEVWDTATGETVYATGLRYGHGELAAVRRDAAAWVRAKLAGRMVRVMYGTEVVATDAGSPNGG